MSAVGTTVEIAQGFALLPAEQVPPTHYLASTMRDWFACYLRS
ncbi:hypothetical protein WHI96_06670 [Pseudonocardia tropica]|uniref:Uncharacterized protein n=1 Tax=Pseudonocardia tropica TaxID=681289 RepID=A0ABV1JRD1_9PSEU